MSQALVRAEKDAIAKLAEFRQKYERKKPAGVALGNLIEQRFQKAADLAIGCCPVSTRMRIDRLIKMTERSRQLIPIQKQVDFIIGGRKIQRVRKSPTQLPALQYKSCPFQSTNELRPFAKRGNTSGRFFHHEVAD